MVKTNNSNKNRLILAILVACLLFVLLGVYLVKRQKSPQNNSTTSEISSNDKINLDPPTSEDVQRTDENKQKNINRDKIVNSQSANSGKKAVSPTITYAEQYGPSVEVSGYVGGIFEDGGTCTVVFTQLSSKVTKSVSAFKNANSVNCPTISAQASEFNPKGNWTVSLSYDSPNAVGTSSNKTVEVK